MRGVAVVSSKLGQKVGAANAAKAKGRRDPQPLLAPWASAFVNKHTVAR